jgi:hypothetical protein
MTISTAEPRNDLLSNRKPGTAFLLAEPGRQYAIYFADGGSVTLDLSAARESLAARWLDAAGSRWSAEEAVPGGGPRRIQAPGPGHWVLLLTAP